MSTDCREQVPTLPRDLTRRKLAAPSLHYRVTAPPTLTVCYYYGKVKYLLGTPVYSKLVIMV